MPILFLLLLCTSSALADSMVYRTHALTLYGDPKYPGDFTHFDYTNPDAPKGGELRLGWIGTFDSLNPWILKGISPPRMPGLIYDTLTKHAEDEIFSEYGRLAAKIEVAEDYSWVLYTLRESARWHDGEPITPEDVVCSPSKPIRPKDIPVCAPTTPQSIALKKSVRIRSK